MKNLTCSCYNRVKMKVLIKTIQKKEKIPDYYLKKLDSSFKSSIQKIKKEYITECPNTEEFCEVFNTPNMGRGIRAKMDLLKDTKIGCYIGPIIDNYVSDDKWKYYFQYVFKTMSIDGSGIETMMSLMNHSDKPNCDVPFEIHLVNGFEEIHITFVLNRDVKKGDEIFIDYGDEYWTYAAKVGINKDIRQKLITDYFQKK